MGLERVTSKNLDEYLGHTLRVLDHGFVRVIDYMGDDTSIVQAARVSYGKGTKKKREDEKLIKYLMKNGHMTPFEMCEIKLHVKMPIFVARQWVRHRTANINEYSARYSELDGDFYVPNRARMQGQSDKNKQASEGPLPRNVANGLIDAIQHASEEAYLDYQDLLGNGLSRELARIVLPTNFYTQWYWKIDLRNLLHFLELRLDEHAQYEIREYAAVIADIVFDWVPVTERAWRDVKGL